MLEIRAADNEEKQFCEQLHRSNMARYLEARNVTWQPKLFEDSWRQFENLIITNDGVRIGALRVLQVKDCLEIRDLQILPNEQGCGVGSWAVSKVAALASERQLSAVHLRVFEENPALHLYTRLGFKVELIHEGKVHMALEL
ncbi:GNAT family N-acetyltransferase [Frateuria sp. GZRe12]|uniref:GNAT family N-acetyltransferase n=1 Tax=Frateuria sp. GZRe12 TaxID=3351533 RepID=UPI003EDBE2F8